MSKPSPKLVVFLGVLGVSLSAIFVRLGDCPSMLLVFYRMGFAALLGLPACVGAWKGEAPIRDRRALGLSLLSGFVLALHFYSYFYAVTHTSIAAAVVLVNLQVFFVAFYMRLFQGERLGRLGLSGMLLAFLGSALLALFDGGQGGGQKLLGDLFGLFSALCFAVYTLLGRRCRKSLSNPLYTGIVYTTAALSALMFLLLSGSPLGGYGGKSLLSGLLMALFCTHLGHSLFNWGLKYLSPSFIATANLLEPVFASLLGLVFLLFYPLDLLEVLSQSL